ncbi:hypothetical protein [Streptomyces longisporoflavus]|uniref:Secreted protein n=1 Tax=Streptomyces longisporoflavus TaxID=28044 RepID=A0ABW7R695_9ACTN
MNSRRLIFVGTAAAAALLLGTGQASAAGDPSTTVSIRTTDSGATGGTGIFWGDYNGHGQDNPEVLGACDKQSDGLRVYASVGWVDSNGGVHAYKVEDTDGANDVCGLKTLPNIADGTKVNFDVCLKNGANGALRYCNEGTAVA